MFLFVLLLVIYYAKSTKGVKRLSRDERTSIFLPENVEEVLIGILLSDGHLQQRSVSSNARLIFNQSGKVNKRPYFKLVYNIFKFCYTDNSEYYIRTWRDNKTNEEYSSLSFATMQLPRFTKIYSLWYLNKKKNTLKY